jgi:transketolase
MKATAAIEGQAITGAREARNRAWQDDVRDMAHSIRRRVLEHTIEHGGYLSQACSAADILALLYGRAMKLGRSTAPMVPPPFNGAPSAKTGSHSGAAYNGPKGADLDRFIVSPTHYALAIYAALIENGRLAPEAMAQFNRDGSRLEMIGGEHSPGHEVNGGSFGQAISQAAGIALARRIKGDTGLVYVFMSDGELQEGQVWEALAGMTFHKIGNVVCLVDVNGQQVDGRMADVMGMEPIHDKMRAFGAEVARIDGHDIDALDAALRLPHPDRPLVILADTSPYRDMDILKSRYPNLHYVRFTDEGERARYRAFLKDY